MALPPTQEFEATPRIWRKKGKGRKGGKRLKPKRQSVSKGRKKLGEKRGGNKLNAGLRREVAEAGRGRFIRGIIKSQKIEKYHS